MSAHHAHVAWAPTRADLRGHRVEVARQVVRGSCAPERGGDPSSADPEALFVASLSSCHMLWFLDFARRDRLRVTGYEDHAEGTLGEDRMTGVVLRPHVTWATDVAPADEARLHERAHAACFIANSVSCPVEVRPAATAGAG